MLESDHVLLCEHDCERDECALCEPEEEAAAGRDASVWAEAHLAGVPFN